MDRASLVWFLSFCMSVLVGTSSAAVATAPLPSNFKSWCIPIVVEVPQQHCTTQTVLLDVSLPFTEAQFRQLWSNGTFYETYLQTLGDVKIQLGPWTSQVVSGHKVLQRTAQYGHPVKYRVPGLGMPKYAGTSKSQFLMEEKSGRQVTITLREVNVISDVPYSDRFEIMTTWVARWEAPGQPMKLTVVQEMLVKKNFLLEKTVEKNSITETKETLAVWIQLAQGLLLTGNSQTNATSLQASDTTTTPSTMRIRRWLSSILSHSLTFKVLAFTLMALFFSPFFITPKTAGILARP